jgi:hypothetical protein
MKFIHIVLFSLVAFSVNAGNIVDTTFKTQVLISQNNGEINGCGIRFVGVQDFTSNKQTVRLVDGSFSVFTSGSALTK